MAGNSELKNAVEVLIKHLKNDPAYRYSWQANIAMAFVDEYDRSANDRHIKEIANDAAIQFLNNLTRDWEWRVKF